MQPINKYLTESKFETLNQTRAARRSMPPVTTTGVATKTATAGQTVLSENTAPAAAAKTTVKGVRKVVQENTPASGKKEEAPFEKIADPTPEWPTLADMKKVLTDIQPKIDSSIALFQQLTTLDQAVNKTLELTRKQPIDRSAIEAQFKTNSDQFQSLAANLTVEAKETQEALEILQKVIIAGTCAKVSSSVLVIISKQLGLPISQIKQSITAYNDQLSGTNSVKGVISTRDDINNRSATIAKNLKDIVTKLNEIYLILNPKEKGWLSNTTPFAAEPPYVNVIPLKDVTPSKNITPPTTNITSAKA
jgi:hypothetical protein